MSAIQITSSVSLKVPRAHLTMEELREFVRATANATPDTLVSVSWYSSQRESQTTLTVVLPLPTEDKNWTIPGGVI